MANRRQQAADEAADEDPPERAHTSEGKLPPPPPNLKLNIQVNNPKRAGSKSRARYERYKVAKTYNQFTLKGGTRPDFLNDARRGYITAEHQDDAHFFPPPVATTGSRGGGGEEAQEQEKGANQAGKQAKAESQAEGKQPNEGQAAYRAQQASPQVESVPEPDPSPPVV
jgi:hypothetical protein